MRQTGVIDLGVGNFANVCRALDADMIQSPQAIDQYRRIVLPGVGAFDAIAQKMDGYRKPIMHFIASGRPFLGICLGMQLLFEGSEEGQEKGLGLLDGNIVKFQGVQTPHMGWNSVTFKEQQLTEQLPTQPYFYFVHSYYLPHRGRGYEFGICEHVGEQTVRFCAAVKKDNVVGVQFHPEKSGKTGKAFLKWFLSDL